MAQLIGLSDLALSMRDHVEGARSLRRALHSRPDVSGDEMATLESILEHLPASASVERVAGTGAVVRIGGAGPAVAVRAELDALPIVEETSVSWAADNGAMHACGHDVHMAATVALAMAVDAQHACTPLVLLLQPREETLTSGAADIIASGLLARHEVATVIGAHVQPLIEAGVVDCVSGAVNASADEFEVSVVGSGGHGAYPHLGSDCVLAVSQFVVAVQQLVSRETNPMDAAVVSVGEVRAGTSPNVRPNSAVARGTVRANSQDHRTYLLQRIEAIAQGIGQISGCEVRVRIDYGEPPLINDGFLADSTRALLDAAAVPTSQKLRSCGADDFAHYGVERPSLMLFVGTGESSGQLHNSQYLPSDDSVDRVALALAAGYLGSRAIVDRHVSIAPGLV